VVVVEAVVDSLLVMLVVVYFATIRLTTAVSGVVGVVVFG